MRQPASDRAGTHRRPDDVTDLLVAVGEAAKEERSGVLLAIDEVQYLAEAELAALITSFASGSTV